MGVGAVGEFGEGDAEGVAEGDEIVGADLAAAGFDVVDGGAGPADGLGEVGLGHAAASAFGADVVGDDVPDSGHGRMVDRFGYRI